jgi:hypothetical protein
MIRQLALLSLLLSSACSSTDVQTSPSAELEAPEIVAGELPLLAYPAKVRIVCTIVGESSRVTVGQGNEDFKYHPAFAISPNMKRVMNVPERSVNFATKPGADQCFTQAQQLVIDELPATWTIVKNEGFTGHCWRAGFWQPCVPASDPFDSYAFPLHVGASKAFEWTHLVDPATNVERQVDMMYFVVVHADVP